MKLTFENSLASLLRGVYPPGMLGKFGVAQIKFSKFGQTTFTKTLSIVTIRLTTSSLLKNDWYGEVVNLLGSCDQNGTRFYIRELILDQRRRPCRELFIFTEGDVIEDHSDSQNGLKVGSR